MPLISRLTTTANPRIVFKIQCRPEPRAKKTKIFKSLGTCFWLRMGFNAILYEIGECQRLKLGKRLTQNLHATLKVFAVANSNNNAHLGVFEPRWSKCTVSANTESLYKLCTWSVDLGGVDESNIPPSLFLWDHNGRSICIIRPLVIHTETVMTVSMLCWIVTCFCVLERSGRQGLTNCRMPFVDAVVTGS